MWCLRSAYADNQGATAATTAPGAATAAPAAAAAAAPGAATAAPGAATATPGAAAAAAAAAAADLSEARALLRRRRGLLPCLKALKLSALPRFNPLLLLQTIDRHWRALQQRRYKGLLKRKLQQTLAVARKLQVSCC